MIIATRNKKPSIEQVVIVWAPGATRWHLAHLDVFGEWCWSEHEAYGEKLPTSPTHWCELPPMPEDSL